MNEDFLNGLMSTVLISIIVFVVGVISYSQGYECGLHEQTIEFHEEIK